MIVSDELLVTTFRPKRTPTKADLGLTQLEPRAHRAVQHRGCSGSATAVTSGCTSETPGNGFKSIKAQAPPPTN